MGIYDSLKSIVGKVMPWHMRVNLPKKEESTKYILRRLLLPKSEESSSKKFSNLIIYFTLKDVNYEIWG